jgi:hypothetical protein
MRMMQVLPNPYRVLDAESRPTAVVPCHPRHAPGEFVGATRSLVVLEKAEFIDIKRTVAGQKVVDRQLTKYDRSKATFVFSTEPVQVPGEGAVGAYYRDRVREGSLIAADQVTARACGVAFNAPDQALAQERDAAVKEYERQFKVQPEWASDSKPAPVAAPK